MHPLPPPFDAAEPGWFVDPVASDMLRWWDGTRWSETEFKLARPLVKPEVRRDLLLGPFGRRGSIANVLLCAVIGVGLLIGALTVHPLLWFGVANCVLLEIIFITHGDCRAAARLGGPRAGADSSHRAPRPGRPGPWSTASQFGGSLRWATVRLRSEDGLMGRAGRPADGLVC